MGTVSVFSQETVTLTLKKINVKLDVANENF